MMMLLSSACTTCTCLTCPACAHRAVDLLGVGVHHEDHQVRQVHGARHRAPAAALLHRRAAGAALRPAAGRGGQGHHGPGQSRVTAWKVSYCIE